MSMLQRYGSPLVEVVIIEQDKADDVMVTWSYPGVNPTLAGVLEARSMLGLGKTPLAFTFSKFENSWIYIHTRGLGGDDEEEDVGAETEKDGALGKVKAFSICLVCKEYNPERYAALSRLFGNVYEKTQTPLTVLQGFLKVLTTGGVGEYDPDDYPAKDAYLATSIKDIIRTFGIEVILLWTALMMKKRVFVYCDKMTTLLRAIRSFPLFVWHRQNFDQLRPFVNPTEVELEDLEKAKVYIAGFTDPSMKNRQDLYDIFIDISERSISVAEHAKSDFRLGAFHKDLAETLVESGEDPEVSALEILKDLTIRSKEFVMKLHSLQVEDEHGNKGITIESLQQRQLPANMGQFLYAVASAEGLAMQ
mmetsp:Transcript_15860/g.61967  ORF Transcript_15860/g.61967 Transcript_15860/m.61967 type:complete len:363 (+) Transcript_15860:105-1193(+)|eukprot:CAMPEP_0114620804 /NCGR_PEP_ID=MMETSP0168-20121206/8911_1 /TAXON_ID=95228 ORGANISM="Vannella sp., Strain DIVA3 517/6/12" /NCGR_SAMPLE_ID=MMETSP0168 /ASSEMBLY_ACC=CAM_ASM_000044 /LENGTH=362 /DNA_ID=CAMNT_0001832001 /DNA_START=26 /DNA_END=1114 /DNA_ORIENTATION=+